MIYLVTQKILPETDLYKVIDIEESLRLLEPLEIVGLDRYVEDNPHYGHRFTISGKETYARILIKKLSA